MKRSTAALLAIVVLAILVWNKTGLFHGPLYESGDDAANSLSVIRAKHFAQLYGCFSRWGFYHPGPAFYYVQGWGEWLFFDGLHACPAPRNAQLLAQLGLNVCFFVIALRTFTLWLARGPGRWCFLLGAVGLATLQLADDRGNAFYSTWPAYPPVLLMLCLLTEGAAVAAGLGGELPLLILAGGFLLHAHVAQPLFVVPLTLLAYTGLWWRAVLSAQDPRPWSRQRLVRSLGAGWRAWPRAHFLGAGLLVIFASPLVIDACRGADSNLAAIWAHLRSHRGEHKTWASSVLYFLQFGAHAHYGGPASGEFGDYDRAGVLAYLRAHALILSGWLGVGLAAAWAVIRQIPALSRGVSSDAVGETSIHPPGAGGARHFLAWTGVFLAVAVLLTLYWGTIQDGPMFYYNAFFNNGIYYFGALVALGMLCHRPPVWLSTPPAWFFSPRVRYAAIGACLVAAGTAAVIHRKPVVRGRGKPAPVSVPVSYGKELYQNISRTIAATAPVDASGPATPRLLVFTDEWPMATAVALELWRAGFPFLVPTDAKVIFGEENVWRPGRLNVLRNGVQVWRVHRFPLPPAAPPVIPTVAMYPASPISLSVTAPVINPADPAGPFVIDYHPNGNAAAYTLFGWSTTEPGGTWSNERRSLLAFVPKPVEGGSVELRVETIPFLAPAKGLSAQRLRVYFNGEVLESAHGVEAALTNAEPLTFVIPAALWNPRTTQKYNCATLGFEFPDGASPASLDPSGQNTDMRFLALWFQSLRFRAIQPASRPAGGPGGP